GANGRCFAERLRRNAVEIKSAISRLAVLVLRCQHIVLKINQLPTSAAALPVLRLRNRLWSESGDTVCSSARHFVSESPVSPQRCNGERGDRSGAWRACL